MTLVGLVFDKSYAFAFADSISTKTDAGQHINDFRQILPLQNPPTTGFSFAGHVKKLYIFEDNYLTIVSGDSSKIKSLLDNIQIIIKTEDVSQRHEFLKCYLNGINTGEDLGFLICYPKNPGASNLHLEFIGRCTQDIEMEGARFLVGGSGSNLFKRYAEEPNSFPFDFDWSTLNGFDTHTRLLKTLYLLISFQSVQIDYANFRFGGGYECAYFDFRNGKWRRVKYSISVFEMHKGQIVFLSHCRLIPNEKGSILLNFSPSTVRRVGWRSDDFVLLRSILDDSQHTIEYLLNEILDSEVIADFYITLMPEKIRMYHSSTPAVFFQINPIKSNNIQFSLNNEALDEVRQLYRSFGHPVGNLLYGKAP